MGLSLVTLFGIGILVIALGKSLEGIDKTTISPERKLWKARSTGIGLMFLGIAIIMATAIILAKIPQNP